MFLSINQIQKSLTNLQSIHPFYGTTFLACKKEGLPVGQAISFHISVLETQFLDEYYRPERTSEYFYRVFRVSAKAKRWVPRKKYASSTLQRTRTQGPFSKAFIHDTNSNKWGWQKDYITTLKSNLAHNYPPYRNKKVPLIDLAVWLYREDDLPRETTSEDLIYRFRKDFRIAPEECDALFELVSEPLLYNEPLLQERSVTWRELREILGVPPDSQPEEGAALHFLELRGIGPADVLRYEPAERLNLVTGDNSLGKTFILETIWWALTGEWLEYPAMPRAGVAKSHPRITFSVGSGRSFQSGEGWHSNENAVRFWKSSPRIPKETHCRCYASVTAYVMMIPPCNSCSIRSKRPKRSRS